jgi:hypothetical protein
MFMIISASRRTDIPGFYGDWLLERLRQGYVLVPDRFRPGRLYRIDLTPDQVDCLVFWTKNPTPFLPKLTLLTQMGYGFYFQYTLTAYGTELEKNLTPQDWRLEAFKTLSSELGPQRVIWRYDPVIIDQEHSQIWHERMFDALARQIAPFTRRCVISFVDSYRHVKIPSIPTPVQTSLAAKFSHSAQALGLELLACAEPLDLSEAGAKPSSCVDQVLIEAITGKKIAAKKDPGQRRECLCCESRDIGTYNSCLHGCLYCYATTQPAKACQNYQTHDPFSPTLIGKPKGYETIIDTRAK